MKTKFNSFQIIVAILFVFLCTLGASANEPDPSDCDPKCPPEQFCANGYCSTKEYNPLTYECSTAGNDCVCPSC